MLLQGQFRDRNEALYTVKILTNNDDSVTRTIGEDGLYFSDDPVVITGQSNDSFDNLLLKTCEINLVSEDYVGDELWAANSHSIVVNIFNETECVFAGYVEPNAYNQPFALAVDSFTLNCIDALSTLEYYNYKDALPNTFDYLRQNSGVVSFKDMLQDIISLFDTLDIDGNHTIRLLYDKSKGVTQGNENTIFNDLGMSESFIIGDEIDDIWTQDKVLGEILKYLNLHIVQIGFDFYMFDWNTLRTRRNQWYNVLTNTSVNLRTPQNVSLAPTMYGGDDTNITVDDVYNQIQVKCNLENEDTVIVSPLNKEDLDSLFSAKQLYCREYQTYVEEKEHGADAAANFRNMLLGQALQYNDKYASTTTDWYIRPMINKNWMLHPYPSVNGAYGDSTDLYEQDANGVYYKPWNVAKLVYDNMLTPCIFQMGSVERNAKQADNSPIGKVSMTPYFYISVNGNKQDDQSQAQPSYNQLQEHAPMIEYLGSGSGSTYSPSDDKTTNYLVFSGKIQLQPVLEYTADYEALNALAERSVSSEAQITDMIIMSLWAWQPSDKEVDDSDKNDKGRMYTRKFFKMTYPTDPIDEENYMKNATYSLNPPCKDVGLKELAYKYSDYEYHQRVDLVSKLALLECELIIGNKRLIETDIDEYGNSTFQWVTLGEEPTFTWADEGETPQTYTITTFTLGINPKLDDYIIGTEFDLQNNVTVPMNIDTEGTAIPITKDDAVSGAVQFRILGPINTMYNEITRRHPTWFRHTKWTTTSKSILAHTQNIILKDFECKIYSDNAGGDSIQSKDLIYMSDETNKFVNKNDSTTFEFITQPSSDECIAWGIKPGVNINSVVNMNTGSPVSSIYNATTNETAKPEEHYVDAYYREYSVPRIVMESTMNINDINWRNTFSSNVLHRNFFVQKQTDDLASATSKITFKEI